MLAGCLEQPTADEDALEVRGGDRVAERRAVEVAEIGDRERRRREREAEIRVRELPAQPLPGAEQDLLVVVGELGRASCRERVYGTV